jgi:ABC-type Mn2+/Zn2+ transport system permease subunit
VVAGIFASFLTNLPTSATIVVLNLLFFGGACALRRLLVPKSKS